mgnify:CR=1 FL=1
MQHIKHPVVYFKHYDMLSLIWLNYCAHNTHRSHSCAGRLAVLTPKGGGLLHRMAAVQ